MRVPPEEIGKLIDFAASAAALIGDSTKAPGGRPG
jgi:hypothetical protein